MPMAQPYTMDNISERAPTSPEGNLAMDFTEEFNGEISALLLPSASHTRP